MSKVLIIDDEKSIEFEIPEVIHHLSKMLDLVLEKKKLPFDNQEWDDAYCFLTNYFEETYCILNEREDIDEILAEFVHTSSEDEQKGIVMSVSIVDFTKTPNSNYVN